MIHKRLSATWNEQDNSLRYHNNSKHNRDSLTWLVIRAPLLICCAPRILRWADRKGFLRSVRLVFRSLSTINRGAHKNAAMNIDAFYTWFMGLGTQYGVNPLVFGAIYVGAIPFFTLSLAWLVRNLKQKKPFVLPALLTGFFFISAYLYLIIAGRNVPFWVYLFIVALVGFGTWSTIRKIRKRVSQTEENT